MKKRLYQRCTSCVMDTTDSKIRFDENGVCDYCLGYKKHILSNWNHHEDDIEALKKLAIKIKKSSKKKKYDCIIGMSGGTDSSYLAYIAKEVMGLNPLLYMVDTGWNPKETVENVDNIVRKLNLDLHIEVVNWEEMKDLQVAFFKSQVPYQDFPQDHAIFAGLYNFAVKNKVKYVLTGANNATESIRPPIEWAYFNDLKFLKDVHKRFGKVKLKTFPICGMFKYRLYYPYFKGMKRVAPLDYIKYSKEEAELFLGKEFGYQKYANKHYENIFTRFYEGYYLPHKFNYDKRKCYYSNDILTGEMTRDEAIFLLEENPYDKRLMEEDKRLIAGKLGLGIEEFQSIIDGENKHYYHYKNSYKKIQFFIKLATLFGKEKRNFR